MAEYKTEKQVNYGWGLSLNMTGKAPAIAKRIFETLADAQAYADDVNDSAIAGLQLSVINDADSSRNGIYFVKSIGDGTNSAVLELVGKGTISGEGDITEVTLPTFTNGLKNVNNTVGVKIDSESESFISVSENGIKVSGIQESIDTTFNNYLNTYPTVDAKTVYLSESEWDELNALVESGEASWEDGVTYMVYSND